jgi:pyruvate formate lyase activating enzyme
MTGFVSNGNATPQVLEYVRPWIDLYKVDLKSFDDRHYHELGGRIGPILESIRRIRSMGLWLEIVTLLIPNFNDADDELRRLTEFIASVSTDIPWHVTAFHTDYKMQGDGQRDTSPADLLRAVEIGREAGLQYVYAGNLPGMVGDSEDTRCPQCRQILIRRYGYLIEDYRLSPEGRCPHCNFQIPGRWAAEFGGQITSRPFLPHRRSRLFTITSRS